MKALVIEPSKLYQEILTHTLNGLDSEVVCTGRADEAKHIMASQAFDCLIVSMLLGDIAGPIFCAQVRSERRYSQLPIFMLTASQDKSALEDAMKSGITEIFHKDDLSIFRNYLCTFEERIDGKGVSGIVLYVEDCPVMAKITKHILEPMGLTLHHFINAEDAIESLSSQAYDLILTDVILGKGMSGLGLVRALRSENSPYGEIPIIVMTGADDTARRIEFLHFGVSDYLSKPVLREELVLRVKNLITHKKLLDKIKSQEIQLRRLAMTDQLTGLKNRHYLMSEGPARVSQSNRHRIPLSMIMVDLDWFKKINDHYGHEKGDAVLSEVGALLRSSCRNEDIASRFGGEEFLLLLPHCNETDAKMMAERLREKIEVLKPAGILITSSFGVASLPLDRSYTFFQLFSASDKAVYQSKSSGRNCVTVCAVTDVEGSFI